MPRIAAIGGGAVIRENDARLFEASSNNPARPLRVMVFLDIMGLPQAMRDNFVEWAIARRAVEEG